MTNTKLYPFSATKHAHDIEFYYNRLFNTMREMETGEIPMDRARYDRICDMHDGPMAELMSAMCCGSPVVWLTGKQISLAKRVVAWAEETRHETQLRNRLQSV